MSSAASKEAKGSGSSINKMFESWNGRGLQCNGLIGLTGQSV